MSTGSLGLGISCSLVVWHWQAKLIMQITVYTLFLVMVSLKKVKCGKLQCLLPFYKLNNLTAFVDFNGLQIDGDITKVLFSITNSRKVQSFQLNVVEVNGHDLDELP